jgi:hypothetical protein
MYPAQERFEHLVERAHLPILIVTVRDSEAGKGAIGNRLVPGEVVSAVRKQRIRIPNEVRDDTSASQGIVDEGRRASQISFLSKLEACRTQHTESYTLDRIRTLI